MSLSLPCPRGPLGRALSVLLCVFALGSLPLRVRADAPPDPIAEARQAARDSASTAEGRRYADEFMAAFGRDLAKNLQGCSALLRAGEVPREELEPFLRQERKEFLVLVRVGETGEVEQVLVRPITTLAGCLRGRLRSWKPGVPPRPGTWVEATIHFDVEDWLSVPYMTLVRTYAAAASLSATSGDRAAAVREAMQWTDERLRRETRVLLKLGRIAECRSAPQTDLRCAQIGRWTTAALMLHADAARQLYQRGGSPKEQLAVALAVAGLMNQDAQLRQYLGRWYLAMAADAEERAELTDALSWAALGLKEFPDAVDLRLVAASAEEQLALLAPVRIPDWAFDEPDAARLRRHLLETSRARRERLERARAALQEALRIAPQRHDARVRLGRVEWRLGNPSEARQAFEKVLAAAPAKADAYLAQLFLGRLAEDDGRLEDAEVAYAVATTLDAESQAARLALSNVQCKRGNTAAARQSVEQALSAAGRRRDDAFWIYPWGPSRGSAALLAALRRDGSS